MEASQSWAHAGVDAYDLAQQSCGDGAGDDPGASVGFLCIPTTESCQARSQWQADGYGQAPHGVVVAERPPRPAVSPRGRADTADRRDELFRRAKVEQPDVARDTVHRGIPTRQVIRRSRVAGLEALASVSIQGNQAHLRNRHASLQQRRHRDPEGLGEALQDGNGWARAVTPFELGAWGRRAGPWPHSRETAGHREVRRAERHRSRGLAEGLEGVDGLPRLLVVEGAAHRDVEDGLDRQRAAPGAGSAQPPRARRTRDRWFTPPAAAPARPARPATNPLVQALR